MLPNVSRSLKVLLPVTSLLFSAGCATVNGDCSAIPMAEYDEAFKAHFVYEVEQNIPETSATMRFIADSIALRDAVRACADR